MSGLSRRDFLKISSLSIGGLAFSRFSPDTIGFSDNNLVRVAIGSVSVYKEPSDKSKIVGTWFRDELVNVYGQVKVEEPAHNPIWYRVWGGYMHRARLQRTKFLLNSVLTNIPEDARYLAEVTVPYTQSVVKKRSGFELLYRLYFGTIHWVVGVEEGPDGAAWYQVLDELHDIIYLATASHLRILPPEEYAPITPDVPFGNKRIGVNLTTQRVTAYEYDKPVFETTISSGLPHGKPGANGIPTITPKGEFNILVKMPSKHMGDGQLVSDPGAYELVGVPWCLFFTAQGHAFHGTYWHENYGAPMSHGCINMRNEDAKWLFRWASPPAPEFHPLTLDRKGLGTRIDIFY